MHPIFTTSKLVIVRYPNWAGGKFLINCLGLSAGAVLQDRQLARDDLDGQLSSRDKFDILIKRLENQHSKFWYDLDLGCQQLFGFMATDVVSDDFKNNIYHNLLSYDLSKSGRYFFIVAHTPTQYKNLKNVFPNALSIVFKNSNKFVIERSNSPMMVKMWNDIKQDHWPMPPKTVQDFNQCSDLVKTDIVNLFPEYIDMLIDSADYEEFDPDSTVYWDNNLYYSETATVDGIKKMYDHFGLQDFNQELITNFYNQWKNIIIGNSELNWKWMKKTK